MTNYDLKHTSTACKNACVSDEKNTEKLYVKVNKVQNANRVIVGKKNFFFRDELLISFHLNSKATVSNECDRHVATVVHCYSIVLRTARKRSLNHAAD